jgi:hypothetical protein
MRVTIRTNGINRILQDIQNWTEEKQQAVKDAINESALNIQTGAKTKPNKKRQCRHRTLKSLYTN